MRSTVALTCVAACLLGFSAGGWNSNFLEVAPRHAAGVYAVSNTFANVAGIITPIVTSALTGGGGAAGWRAVFGLVAAVEVVALVRWSCTVTTEPLVE